MNRAMTVTQLSSYLKGVFDDEELLHDITLSGEVVEVSYSDRHTFLTLADGDCSVRCVHFSSRDDIEAGARVALRGSVDYYGKRNSVTFRYREFFECGEGVKNARLAELKNKLRSLGYFEDRPRLPKYILSVAVVTSPDGAAIRDFIRVVHDKNKFVKILVYPVKVQGEGAAAQMTDAVKKLAGYRVDAIVLCRGGGSDEDLACFNDEALATAVANSKIPVISAVGHEIDYTLCDYCAGTRAGTPSIAGEIVNEHAGALVYDIVEASKRAALALDSKLEMKKTAVADACADVTRAIGLMRSGYMRDIDAVVRRGYYALVKKRAVKSGRLEASCEMLKLSAARFVGDKRGEVAKNEAMLRALDPKRIIKVGYAAAIKDGKRVTSAESLKSGDELDLVFADGTATAVVKNVEHS